MNEKKCTDKEALLNRETILKDSESLLNFFTQQRMNDFANHILGCGSCFESILKAVNHFIDKIHDESVARTIERIPQDKQTPFVLLAKKIVTRRLNDIYNWTEEDSARLMEKYRKRIENTPQDVPISKQVEGKAGRKAVNSHPIAVASRYRTIEELNADLRIDESLEVILEKLLGSPSLRGKCPDRVLNKFGSNLSKILDVILVSSKLLKGEERTPFDVLRELDYKLNPDGEWLDMTTDNWVKLPVEKQIQYATAYQQWYAEQIKIEIEISETKIDMLLIPPGKFWMGSPESESESERKHEVLISKPFWCGKYSVTQEQWQAVMVNNPSRFTGDPKKPVENVSCEESKEFCSQLGVQLLSEAHWEYACRAGTTTEYSFGDDPEQLADYGWYSKNSGSKSHPVGQKQSNAFGLYDMHGNVWEWCEDLYQASSNRVIRGGGWSDSADGCRSAYRIRYDPSYRWSGLGLRVCRFL